MPIFIKFNEFGDEQNHESLNNAFLKIDEDFQKLANASPDAFLTVEADHQIKENISAIGDFFHKLDDEFLKISDAGLRADDFALKLTQPPTTGATEELPAVQSDFLNADADLKVAASDLGAVSSDFLKLDAAPDLNTLKAGERTVGADFLKLAIDTINAGTDFTNLGDDLIALGAGSNSKELDGALNLLGDQVLEIGSAFEAVALDFEKLRVDFVHLGGGGLKTAADFLESQGALANDPMPPGPVGADFFKLEQDFQVLNHDIGGAFFDGKQVIHDLFAQNGNDSGHPTNDDSGPFSGGTGTL